MQHQATYVPTGFGANDVQIMAGTFDDFSFDDVVQVLGLSRQCLRLLIRQGEAAFSEILLKAGQVLEARMPMTSDPDNVFTALFGRAVHGSGLSFAVYHTEPTGPFPMPRCRLQEVYDRVKSTGQASGQALGAASAAPLASRPSSTTHDVTVRLENMAAPDPTLYGVPSPSSRGGRSYAGRSSTGSSGYSSPQAAPDELSRLVAAQLQPMLRDEVAAVLSQVQSQAQALHTMDGRLQALPQLVAAELRVALARQERSTAAPVAAPNGAGANRGLLFALGFGIAVLLLAVVALAVKVLR